jgi:hypothetical protein
MSRKPILAKIDTAQSSGVRAPAFASSRAVMKKRWEFRLDEHDGRRGWTWSVSMENGPTISCIECFATLSLCIQDAVTAGYTGETGLVPGPSTVWRIPTD